MRRSFAFGKVLLVAAQNVRQGGESLCRMVVCLAGAALVNMVLDFGTTRAICRVTK